MEVTIRREKIYPTPGRTYRFAWKYRYYTTGPDGTRFDNDSIVTLRDVLRRKYGRDVKIIEPWKGTGQ